MPWSLVPAKRVTLPRRPLTPEQQAANDAAVEAHRKRCAEIDALAKQLEYLGASILYDEETGDTIYPELTVPHDPEAIDVERLDRQQRAYYAYLQATENSYFKSMPVDVGKELVAAGIGVRWAEVGMFSVGVAPYVPTPPPLPDWARGGK